MKKLITLSALFFSLISNAQKNETYIKANAVFLPVGMLNVAVERGFTEHITGQIETFISPWKSFAGKHAQVYMLGVDGRYYFSKSFEKFYVGGNISYASFDIQKYGYWNDNHYTRKNGEVTPYINSDLYQRGFSMIFGVVGGYQFKWKEKWNIDLFLGVGSIQSFYRGYDTKSGDRYDEGADSEMREWNRSGELLPYRGGIMISYKL